MKKSSLWTGFGFVCIAVLCLLSALLIETPFKSLLWGFTGAFGAPGIVQICKYCKWNSPNHRVEYQERFEQEQIDLRDERKEMLRNKSGRYAYVFNMVLTCIILLTVSVLSYMDIVFETRWILITLSVWVLVQYFAGIVIYRLLSRKY